MDISIVIVNYNVKFFLRQCINSIYKSVTDLTYDIWVVDNNSQDQSVKMIEEEFPLINLISNVENIGFSKANNLALKKTSGKYVLFLNPDTIVSEDTLDLAYKFAEQAMNFGALGVKMIDGAGNFHPESKRGFPTIWNSFCRMTGLYKLSPDSRVLNGYYLGHLAEEETSEIEVLCGAFFFANNQMVKKIGGFDEDYFMYGEDIDLSFQILKEGKLIYYYPKTSIIHFKGESGKKLDSTYLKSFYGSMITFLRKNYSGIGTKLFLPFLSLAIILKASFSVMNRIVGKYLWPLLDILLLVSFLEFIKNIWAVYYYADPSYFDSSPIISTIFIFSFIWIIGLYIGGKYDSKYRLKNIFFGYAISSFLIFFIYALLPEYLRSSRFLTIVGLAIGAVLFPLTLAFKNYSTGNSFSLIKRKKSKIITVGSEKSSRTLEELISRNNEHAVLMGNVNTVKDDFSFGIINDLGTIVRELKVNEIIFSSSDIDNQEILTWMSKLGPTYSYRIASKDNFSLVSSHSSKKQGEISTLDIDFRLNELVSCRIKRGFDITASIILLFVSPFLLLFSKVTLDNIWGFVLTLFSKKTLLSYNNSDDNLPSIKPGVFQIDTINSRHEGDIAFHYAKNYSLLLEFEYLLKILVHEK